jgi:pilus assembly protein Flp/PilA
MTTQTTHDPRGASSVEYALLAALIAAVIVSTVVIFGGQVDGLFENTNASFDSAVSP